MPIRPPSPASSAPDSSSARNAARMRSGSTCTGWRFKSDHDAPTEPSRSSGICSAASCSSEIGEVGAARIGRGRATSMRICQATRSSRSSASTGTLPARRSWRSGSRMASPISAIR